MPAYANTHGKVSRETCQLSSPITASIGDSCARFRDQTLPSGILNVYKRQWPEGRGTSVGKKFPYCPPHCPQSSKMISPVLERNGATCTPALIQDCRIRMIQRPQTLQVEKCPSCIKQPHSLPAPHVLSWKTLLTM